MAVGGRKVGEAWIGIHAYSTTMDREIKEIAKRDADTYAESFDRTWEQTTRDRYDRDLKILAQALDTEDMGPLVKRFGDVNTAMRKINIERRRMLKTGEMTDEAFERSGEILKSMASSYREGEKEAARLRAEMEKTKAIEDQDKAWQSYAKNVAVALDADKARERTRQFGRLRLELESMDRVSMRRLDDSLKRVMNEGDWSVFIRNVGKGRDAMEELGRSLVRVSNDYDDFTVGDFDRVQRSLQEYLDAQRAVAEQVERRRRIELAHGEALQINAARERERARLLREIERAHGEALRENIRLDKEAARITKERTDRQNEFNYTLQRTNKAFNDMRNVDIATILSGRANWDQIEKRYASAGGYVDRLTERLHALHGQGRIADWQMSLVSERIVRSTERMEEDSRGPISRLVRRWAALDRAVVTHSRRIETGIGRAFGRGSRNDFVNMIGGMVQALATLPGAAIRFFTRLGLAIDGVGTSYRTLTQGGMARLPALLASVAGGIGMIAAPLVTLAVGLAAASVLLPAIISGITMLAGALTAIVGVLVTGLLGGIVALLPVLGALGAALGGAVIVGVRIAKDRTEEFSEAVDKLKGSFEVLLQEADPIIDRLIRLLNRLDDEFLSLGRTGLAAVDALTSGFDRFIDNLEDPAMDKFFAQWGESIPKIIGSLANGIADFSTGLIAFLAPVLPYAEALAQNIEGAFESFKNWSMSAEGQNSIGSWMERAWEAAGQLWNTLVNVGDILFTIFSSATEGSGGTFLSWLERVTGEWATFLNSEEGQAAMEEFWEDVTDFMREAKDLIRQVIDTWNELDTEQARDNFNKIMNAVEMIFKTLEKWGPVFETVASVVVPALVMALMPVKTIVDSVYDTLVMMGIIKPPTWAGFGDKVKAEVDKARTAAGLQTWLPDSARTVETWLRDFGNNYDRLAGGIAGTLGRAGVKAAHGDTTAEAWMLNFESRMSTRESGADLAVAAWTRALKEGLVTIPEKTAPEAKRAITDVQRRMLEDAGIDPEAMAKSFRIAEGIARWETMLQGDMRNAAQLGTSAYSDSFIGGMGGWLSRMSPVALGVGSGVTEAFGQGVTGIPGRISLAMEMARVAMQAEQTTMSSEIQGGWGVINGLTNAALNIMSFTVSNRFKDARDAALTHAAGMRAETAAEIGQISGQAGAALGTLSASVAAKFSAARAAALGEAVGMANSTTAQVGTMPGRASAALSTLPGAIGSRMSAAVYTAASKAAEIRSSGSNISGMVGAASAALSGLSGAIGSQMAAALRTAQYYAAQIRAAMASARSANVGVGIGLPRTATGGVFYGAQARVIGEAGAEAVVPLNRNLSLVDPSVRLLSAFAQGKLQAPAANGPTVEAGAIQVIVPNSDPRLVAESVMDRLVASIVP